MQIRVNVPIWSLLGLMLAAGAGAIPVQELPVPDRFVMPYVYCEAGMCAMDAGDMKKVVQQAQLAEEYARYCKWIK